MEILKVLLLIIIITCGTLLGLWVLLSDKKSNINKTFFALSFSVIIWNVFGFLAYQSSSVALATLYFRINFAAVLCFLVSFYLFTNFFPIAFQRKNKYLDYIIGILGLVLLFFSVSSGFVIDTVIFESASKISVKLGTLGNVFYVYAIFITVLSLYNLIKKYKTVNQLNKSKVLYFLVGALLYAAFNIVFNVVIFFLMPGDTKFTQFGDFSAIFLIGFTAYAIMKHQLFNIKVIATESIVIVLSLILFVQVFLANSTSEAFISGLIWLLASYGGWTLIKSVRVEIKQKDDLAKLAKELEEANEHLKSVDKLKDDFLSMASHELNTPIAAIEGYLSMILEEHMAGDLSPKAEQYLTSVFNSSKRLAGMVKDLLNVSRIESNRVHLIMKETQIDDLIKQVEMEIAPKVKQAKHTLIYHKPVKAMPLTWMDNTRITEVLINIIGNAIKYTPDGGKIEVNTMCDDKKIVVSVKDNGKGIPKDKFGCVFEKFTQVDVLKDEVKGTGLGMYISKRFVELHKGKIWFTSEGDGKGSTFFFSIPVLEKQPFDPHAGEGDVLH